MNDNGKILNRIDKEDFLKLRDTEKQKLFDDILYEISRRILLESKEETKSCEEVEILPPTKRQKRRLNRLFRERIEGDFIPYPDVDNLYERARSKIVVKLKINEFKDKRERFE